MPRTAVLTVAAALVVATCTVGAGVLLSSEQGGLARATVGAPAADTTVATTAPAAVPTSTSTSTSTPTRPTIPPGLTDISVSEVAADALPGQEAAIQAARDEGAHIGAIEIPKLDLLHYIYEGVQLTTLDLGPGHWPGTALPGQAGNAVIAGHRTTLNAAFADLDQLEKGDSVIFQTADGQHTYEVASTEIVDPSALWIADQTEEATATLFACHPPGSVSQRIVVRLELDA